VIGDGGLSPVARLIACQLGFGFANHETGECRPGAATLAKGCATSLRTVERSLMDLEARGWIKRRGGEGPGIHAAILFAFPDQRPPDLAGERPPDLAATPASSGGPPCTPYKDKPQLNHSARPHPRAMIRGLPKPQCATTAVAAGSWTADRWNAWLQAEGFPPLERIGRKIEGGFEMPITVAPSKGEQVPYRIARRWAEWLRSKA
jgi:hypothetical protein